MGVRQSKDKKCQQLVTDTCAHWAEASATYLSPSGNGVIAGILISVGLKARLLTIVDPGKKEAIAPYAC